MTKTSKKTEGQETAGTDRAAENVLQGKKKTAQTLETMVYCGPSIKNKLRTGETFIHGLPESVEKLSGDFRAVKRLIVPLSTLVETRHNLNQEGSTERISYKRIEEEIKNGRL